MKSFKAKATLGAILVGSGLLLGSQVAEPVVAQVRAALVRNVDTPALAPFRAGVSMTFTTLNDQRLVTTVPAGKRLVIEHVSYWTYGPIGDQAVFAVLRSGQFGPFALHLPINPPHISATSSLQIQDASVPVTVYFEAGEEVWLSASKNTGGSRTFEAQISGYFVTP